jgi:hypothetical protein
LEVEALEQEGLVVGGAGDAAVADLGALANHRAVHALTLAGGLDPPQTFFDPLLEAFVHGLFFLASIAAAAEDECFGAFRRRTELHFHAVAVSRQSPASNSRWPRYATTGCRGPRAVRYDSINAQ